MIRLELSVRGHKVSASASTPTDALRYLRVALYEGIRGPSDAPDPEAVRAAIADLDATVAARMALRKVSNLQEAHGSTPDESPGGIPLVWLLEELSHLEEVSHIEVALQEAARAHRVATRGTG